MCPWLGGDRAVPKYRTLGSDICWPKCPGVNALSGGNMPLDRGLESSMGGPVWKSCRGPNHGPNSPLRPRVPHRTLITQSEGPHETGAPSSWPKDGGGAAGLSLSRPWDPGWVARTPGEGGAWVGRVWRLSGDVWHPECTQNLMGLIKTVTFFISLTPWMYSKAHGFNQDSNIFHFSDTSSKYSRMNDFPKNWRYTDDHDEPCASSSCWLQCKTWIIAMPEFLPSFRHPFYMFALFVYGKNGFSRWDWM